MAGVIEQTQSFDDLYQSASRGFDLARTAVTLVTLARRSAEYFEFTDSTPELERAYEKALAEDSVKELDKLAVTYLARTSIILKRIDEYGGKTEEQLQKAQDLRSKLDKLYNTLEEIIKTKPDTDNTKTNGEGRNWIMKN
jgi:hypothetical protein